ncbi:MAG: zf-HC2 domain-containing protein [Gemmatimonadales bacterium]
MHSEWTDLLSAYLDNELDAVTRRRVDGHLRECAACRGVLEDLRRIVAAAPGYAGTEPSRDLWPAIRRQVGPSVLPFARPATRPASRPVALAAAALLLVGIGAAGAWLLRGGSAGPVPAPTLASAPPTLAPGTDSTLLANRREVAYDAAVSELEATLRANRSKLDTATVRVLEESLAKIDAAIAEARAAIQRDTANAYLNGQITARMRAKVNLLRLATRALASET